MKRKMMRLAKVVTLLSVTAVSSAKVYCQVSPAVQSSRHYLRAPDVIPGTLPEMRDSAYWIARMKHPDEVIMTVRDIQRMNDDFLGQMKRPEQLDTALRRAIDEKIESSPGLVPAMPDLVKQSPMQIAEITKSLIEKQVHYLQNGEYGNILGIRYTKAELSELESEMNADKVGGIIALQRGIAVSDMQLRIIPLLRPEYVGLLDKDRTRWDVFNLDIVPISSPVEVLHVSASGASLLILSSRGYGWVDADKIAFSQRQKITAFTSAKNFIVCTDDKVPYYSDARCLYASGFFRMGDQLPRGNDPQTVMVPTRQLNGQLLIQRAWLKKDADVHQGFLLYTRRHIIGQSFKLIDRIYDWTGAWFGRNHATSIRDVFACFGFQLPSNGEVMSVFNSSTRKMFAKEGKEAQYSKILANEPFVTIQITGNGHSQLFLGDYNGEPIVLDTHGYGYPGPDGQNLEIRRECVGTMSLPNYFLKQDVNFITLAPIK